MRIAITSDIYYPMVNGVAVFAHNLAKGLAYRGHEVMVVCPSFNGQRYNELEKDTGVINCYLSSTRMPFYPDQISKIEDSKTVFGKKIPKIVYKNGMWISPYPYSELDTALDEFKPDLIHNQTAEMIAIATLLYARKREIPIVSTGHAYPDNLTGQLKFLKPIKKPLDAILRIYMASFLKNSEYATMPTEMAIEDLVPKNRKRFKVPVEAISNGIDLSFFKSGERPSVAFYERYSLPKDKKIVLYVGRVDPEKSIDVAIKAFLQASKKQKDLAMVIVGDGIHRAELEEMVEKMARTGHKAYIGQNIFFMGKITGDELLKFYHAGDVFLTASETETQGLVLVEAAATGLPIVAVDAGAVREICVNGENGVLCKKRDIEQMAEGILTVLADDGRASEMRKASLKIAKRHDLNGVLEKFEEVYQKAIDIKESKRKS